MSNHDSFSNISSLTSVTSSESAHASKKSLSNDCMIRRISIDSSVVLGSLYDARIDCVLDTLSLATGTISKPLYKPICCNVIKGHTSEREHLLDMMGIQGRVTPQLEFNMIPTLFFDDSSPIDTHTRFLHYYYSSEEKSISNQQNIIPATLPENIPKTTATHMVTSIKLGIYVIVRLQLPPDYETDLDCLLERIYQQLTQNTFGLTRDRRNLLNQIYSMRIYSNIPDLCRLTKLTDVCEEIIRIKSHVVYHNPLEYGLRPYYSWENDEYITIEPTNIDKIKQYLRHLSNMKKPLTISLSLEEKRLVEKHLNVQLDELQQQISSIEEMYSTEMKRIGDMIVRIRSGKLQQERIVEMLMDDPKEKLQNQMRVTSENLDGMKEKLKKSSSPVNFINVLLLGESGVGKSTFINAFVNYLAFENLDEALKSEPIALMPVSFLMTVNDDFEERILTFGNVDSNEDHHHPGQSVTQHCRSYVFDIGNETKLRLIDTPGMGDTRGLDQDDLNMQHILSFINNLSHLNAICIILKPNESRLNIVFRSYFTRLLNFLGDNARHNIIFCFTNTRATFFAPGNTGPLLKSMIKSHTIKDIPFEKANSFCFDSESFRYLIALQNGIQFDQYQEQEYRQSWIKSVPESIRMFKYICQQLKSYPQNEWQSIEHAQFQITELIHPMIETLRNIIFSEENLAKSSSAINGGCKHSPSLSNGEDNQACAEMKSVLDQIRYAMQEFVRFFAHVFRTSAQIDPILSAFKNMIDEEESKHFNSILHDRIVELKKEYEEIRRTALSNPESINLLVVYDHIKRVSEIDSISKQIDVIRQAKEHDMKEKETQVLQKFSLQCN